MALKWQKHDKPEAVEQEFANIDSSKEPGFVWDASRAPNSSDKNARIWFYRNGSTMAMYVFDKTAGAWRGPTNFS